MRKAISTICILLCLALLPACGEKQDETPSLWSVHQIAGALLDSQPELSLRSIEPESALYAAYLRDSYGLDAAQVLDGVVLVSGGVSAREVAVLRFASAEEAAAAKDALESYIARREAAFTGYFPEEADMIAESHAFRSGATAALAICPKPDAAFRAFTACFHQNAPETERSFTPVAAEDMARDDVPGTTDDPADWSYDEARILRAWRTGVTQGLAQKDLDILDAVYMVLNDVVREDMSDYEKELAVHDWMVYNAEYDTNILTQLPDFEEDPDNANPYGFLVHRKGICKGYTSSFQLFMDILGIECISVMGEGSGTHDGEWEEHAWNLVRLDGEWYVVDCTWDDPLSYYEVSDAGHHKYFNVTSDFLRSNYHRWDEAGVPEATATKYAWGY